MDESKDEKGERLALVFNAASSEDERRKGLCMLTFCAGVEVILYM